MNIPLVPNDKDEETVDVYPNRCIEFDGVPTAEDEG